MKQSVVEVSDFHQYEEAVATLTRALEIDRKVFGPDTDEISRVSRV